MPDITMCRGSGCLRRNTCYRATAKPTSDRQSFFVEAPVKPDQTCGYYWNNSGQTQRENQRL